METTFIFHDRIELPLFASFTLLRTAEGTAKVLDYYRPYAELARSRGVGFIPDTPTFRASSGWASQLGYSSRELAEANRRAVDVLLRLRAEYETPATPVVISAVIGPRGDGYRPGEQMSAAAAQAYHTEQAATFRDTEADMITAVTMNYVAEAIGIVRAARAVQMPVAVSFTVETDGRLPTGQSLKDVIREVDAATGSAPIYYMINCAHPTHFSGALEDADWTKRLRGIRANASRRSHAELDNSTDLDAGDPAELGLEYRLLLRRFPHLNVLGGCCGTDLRHVEAICRSCLPRDDAHAA